MSHEHIRSVEQDASMDAANAVARGTFKFLWRELSWEYRRIMCALELSAVKMPFENPAPGPGESEIEQMWVGDITFDGHVVRGTLLNDARSIASLRAGAPAERPLSEISDWLYAMRGRAYGAFTVQVIRASMSRSERGGHDRAWGFDFGDPAEIALAPAPEAARSGWKLFAKKTPLRTAAELEREDHPMCLNMVPKMLEALSSDPSIVSQVDADGWTLLQREALAGNAAMVRGLLDHGAPRDARTPLGDTALDLAQRMGWPLVVEALEAQ
ncbi:MAG: DUF2314 domain-containing protein [Polyangiales bacterium]